MGQGPRSFQCSRRADVLKLWVAFQRYGVRGIGALYDHLCELARAMHEQLEEHPRFEAMHEPESNILCFRWVGDGTLRRRGARRVQSRAARALQPLGRGMDHGTNLDGRRVLRVTIMNPRTTEADVAEIIDGLARQAEVMRSAN